MKKALALFFAVALAFAFFSCKSIKLVKVWEIKTGDNVARVHFIKNHYLYITSGKYMEFGSPNKNVSCVDIKNGKIIWEKSFGDEFIIHFMSHSQDKIYIVPSRTNTPVWLDAKTGKVLENISLPAPEKPALMHKYKGMSVLAKSGKNHKILCQDPSTKKIIWSYSFKNVDNIVEPNSINFSYIVQNDMLYIAKYDGSVEALKIK